MHILSATGDVCKGAVLNQVMSKTSGQINYSTFVDEVFSGVPPEASSEIPMNVSFSCLKIKRILR